MAPSPPTAAVPNARWLSTLAIAFVAGLAIGYRDLGADDVQLAVGLLVVTSATLAALAPRAPWLTAIVVAAGIPLMHLWAEAVHRPMPYDTGPFIGVIVLPLIPALIGAYGAALARRLVAA